MFQQLYICIVWSLVVGYIPGSCSFAETSCNLDPILGSCENTPGPSISCSQELYELGTAIQQIRDSFHENYNINSTNYDVFRQIIMYNYRLKAAIDNLIYFGKETLAQQDYVTYEFCVPMLALELQAERLDIVLRNFYDIIYWNDYIFPVFGSMMFIIGMVANCMIPMMVFKHEDLRTGSNIVIVNLAIGDVLLLIDGFPRLYSYITQTYSPNDPDWLWVMIYLSIVTRVVSAYSMVILSLLRFLATIAIPGNRAQRFLENRTAIVLLLILTWVLAAVIGAAGPIHILYTNSTKEALVVLWLRFAFMSGLPLVLIAAFSIAASRALLRTLPGEQTQPMLNETRARKRGAKVILSLVIIFLVSHVPGSLHFLIGFRAGFHYIFIVHLLTLLNPSLNPIALFIGSRNFRIHLKSYFFKLKGMIPGLPGFGQSTAHEQSGMTTV